MVKKTESSPLSAREFLCLAMSLLRYEAEEELNEPLKNANELAEKTQILPTVWSVDFLGIFY